MRRGALDWESALRLLAASRTTPSGVRNAHRAVTPPRTLLCPLRRVPTRSSPFDGRACGTPAGLCRRRLAHGEDLGRSRTETDTPTVPPAAPRLSPPSGAGLSTAAVRETDPGAPSMARRARSHPEARRLPRKSRGETVGRMAVLSRFDRGLKPRPCAEGHPHNHPIRPCTRREADWDIPLVLVLGMIFASWLVLSPVLAVLVTRCMRVSDSVVDDWTPLATDRAGEQPTDAPRLAA
ncbi:MAG: hypothetical protein QOK15_3934 [Nocardioidaceae bacterium]|nr:hypothetical protein [Nocardioidaceae bacterium]